MYYFKLFIIISFVILTSCSPTIQNNGLSETKFNKIKIEIGKTSKKELTNKYGPPVFESVFNKNVIYYVSHKTSYKLLNKSKTKKLLVYEIILNDENIVENFRKYSNKDSFDISVSDKSSDTNTGSVLKEFLNNLGRQNIQN